MTKNGTTRRELLRRSAVLASLAAASSYGTAYGSAAKGGPAASKSIAGLHPLTPPAAGAIPVAFPLSEDAVVIDFAGPWEVFLNAAMVGAGGAMDMSGQGGFRPYIVAEKSAAIETYGGMKIVPNYTFANAPAPKLIVIAMQSGENEAMLHWVREASKHTNVTMSICTGAFVLAKTGLLSGKAATTHHSAYAELAKRHPDIRVKRGYRFVDEGNVASSGGLTSGIDLAFHIVERYFGREKALQTALNMEYQGKGWMDASGADNAIYAK